MDPECRLLRHVRRDHHDQRKDRSDRRNDADDRTFESLGGQLARRMRLHNVKNTQKGHKLSKNEANRNALPT